MLLDDKKENDSNDIKQILNAQFELNNSLISIIVLLLFDSLRVNISFKLPLH